MQCPAGAQQQCWAAAVVAARWVTSACLLLRVLLRFVRRAMRVVVVPLLVALGQLLQVPKDRRPKAV
jgi:hypothetical protein